MSEPIGYTGPPRDPTDVIKAALANPELMRQLAVSLKAERRGDMGTPLKELQAKHRLTRSA